MGADEFQAAFDAAFARAAGRGAGEAEADGAASVLAAAGERYGSAAAYVTARVLRECAARGWAQADLVRMAGRELDARHLRLAAHLAGGGDLPGFVRTERLDRFSAAALLVDVLRLYGRLPAIPVQTAGGPGASRGESKVLGRIRALLAKAESTGFPEEAEALSAKAQELMARHSVDEALLAGSPDGLSGPGSGTGPRPGVRRVGVDRPYEGAKALLLDAVASANRCEAVWAKEFGFSTVVGYESDLDAVELLYTSLLVQADRALHRGVSRSRDFRESFLIAYASRIRERLAAASHEVALPGEVLPVLASREAAVRQERGRLFPSTVSTRVKGRDAEGFRDGREAADAASFPG